MLPPKQWAPTSTLEERPDMISQTYTLHRYDPAAQEWQVCQPEISMIPIYYNYKMITFICCYLESHYK